MLTRTGARKRSGGTGEQEPKRTRSKKSQVLGHDGIGVDDHFSRLPADCLLDVFRRVTRTDIYNLFPISSTINSIATNTSLNCVKWEGGSLYIGQTDDGYGFEFKMYDAEYPWKKGGKRKVCRYPDYPCFSYQYEVKKDGSIRSLEEQTKLGSIQWFKDSDAPHNWPFPDQLFNKIKEIGIQHKLCFINTTTIPLTLDFVAKLQSSIGCHYVEMFESRYEGEEEYSKETLKSFTNFLRNVQKIYLCQASIITEEFINELGRSEVTTTLQDSRFFPDDHERRFIAHKTILPNLLNFDDFDVPNMIINVSWIAEFTLMLLNAVTKRLADEWKLYSWSFSVDQPLTLEKLSQHNSPGYKITKYSDESFDIKQESDGLNASISCYIPRQENPNLYALHIRISRPWKLP